MYLLLRLVHKKVKKYNAPFVCKGLHFLLPLNCKMNIRFSKSRYNNSKGSTLIEALIALSAIVIVLAATSSLVITSLNNSTFNRDQNQANKLAQQGVEYIRDKVANKEGFDEYVALAGTVRCMKDIGLSSGVITAGVCDATGVIDDTYRREILLTHNSPDCALSAGGPATDTLKAIVTVYWQSGKCPPIPGPSENPFCHSQEVSSCFSDPSSGSTGI